jgi:hypothetical protein
MINIRWITFKAGIFFSGRDRVLGKKQNSQKTNNLEVKVARFFLFQLGLLYNFNETWISREKSAITYVP